MDRSTINIQNCDDLSRFYRQQYGFGAQRCWTIHEKASTIQWEFQDPIDGGTVQDGARKIAFSCLISGLTMVYGRCNYS